MNEHEQEIASALREMAGRAATPPPKVETAWRAGRRRRRNVMTASVAGAAGVTAAAVLVPMAVNGGTASPGLSAARPGGCGAEPTAIAATPAAGAAAPSTPLPTACPATSSPISMLNPPIIDSKVQLSRVSNVAEKPCPQDSHGVPSYSHRSCYYLTGKTITVTLESVKVVQQPGATTAQGKPVYAIDITLARSDAATMQALTDHMMNLSPPADDVAWIVNGRVVTVPGTVGELSTSFQLGGGSLQSQEMLAAELVGMVRPIIAHGPVPAPPS
jgi:hypothetical protein